jgi:GNAT superfamily N-acetyltransferase
MSYRIRTLADGVETASFDCGEEALDLYLRRYASQDVRRDVARVFVLTKHDDLAALGYYTLSAASISVDGLPEDLRRKLPRYPLPVALMGRLAIHRDHQGHGLASVLLVDALKRITAAGETLAISALVVDAKSDNAAAFYRHFGFLELLGQKGRWFLPRSRFPK